jgi:peptidoglycan/xylan/chitin deacetylase (PgdA/CDA1 family)
MKYRYFCVAFVIIHLLASFCFAEEKRGGIVIAFDDGYPSWTKIIAPELARVGGMATGFVNNQRIHFGDLSFEDLRALQNKYNWEIGDHTYHHFNAPIFVQQKGLSTWIKNELEASVLELQSQGLKIQSFVFPYNAFTKELSVEIMKRFKSFRRDEIFPVTDTINDNGSIPAGEIDISFYVPITLILEWIDFAKQQNKLLFLYGHKVLPDEEFFTGTVNSLSTRTLVSKEKINAISEKDMCLVPDTKKRIYRPVKVETMSGDTINTFQGDLTRMSETGATFIVGPCYGMQLSYFRRMIEYAAEHVPFYTVEQAVSKMKQSSKK